ncbi:MAG: PD40 domain-containing protein [Planctomycetes bacterium]|nr:PD40 domain-containing protein [Planctomycetota bacterium]
MVQSSLLFAVASLLSPGGEPQGYYRSPAIHGDTIVFSSEGDLWKVPTKGGVATRLTSHPGEESDPAISPDGSTLAFVAEYEGPREIYTMPLNGGLPTRRTFDASRVDVAGFTPDGKLLYSTDAYSTLPQSQLVKLDLASGERVVIPLAQASDGVTDDSGKTLFFTRLPFQGSHTKRYQGGTAQNLWRFADGDAEATPLTADYAGTSKNAMWWKGRVYFASDRDGTMNLWSMTADGKDLRQLTYHVGLDVAHPSLSDGKIVYQLGADLHVVDVASGAGTAEGSPIAITLTSDFDQTREHWVAKPMDYLTTAHLSPDGDRLVLTARGRVFVAPQKQGRFVETTRAGGVRYRVARFLPDGKSLVAMSDESGEIELWKLPANGVGAGEQLTTDGEVLRWDALPSPDGAWIAHYDKNWRLWIWDVKAKTDRKIDESTIADFEGLRWSPDSRWLAYVTPSDNFLERIKLWRASDGSITFATTDRFDSSSPAWSPDGQWLYFLSARHLETVVSSPWGNYQPEPYLDKTTKIYQLALKTGLRSPFAPNDELHPAKPKDEKKDDKDKKDEKKADDAKPPVPEVVVDLAGIEKRLLELPVPAGNYANLSVNDKALFFERTDVSASKTSLVAVAVGNENVEVKEAVSDIRSSELSADGKKMLVRKGDALYVVDAPVGPVSAEDLEKKKVDLSAWKMSVSPREEWRQMFTEAWRLERDYFYDRGMHGVDWKAMLKKYLPLVDRVRTREELSDLIAQMVSELSALHIFVHGGDRRHGSEEIDPASLGARLVRDPARGGYRVDHVYQTDPDEPDQLSPLARPGVDVKDGDVIDSIDGVAALAVPDLALLLREKANRQVLLHVKPASGEERDVIVMPVDGGRARDLRYDEWEYTRRLAVDQLGGGDIGYVHLRAMGRDNWTEWAKGFYPVFTRKGLVIDVRHNQGGNIDSWILEKLLRKAWFYWSERVGRAPSWNMQFAFRGHVVVLCDEWTASDGEAFSEGFRRLGLGKVIGTRTWGGEIWLSSSNFLVDRGIATAAEYGVFGPEGKWLIEGRGVEPDIVVDNLPHATFQGKDAQLEAAVDELKREIAASPVVLPPVPAHPDKSLKAGR